MKGASDGNDDVADHRPPAVQATQESFEAAKSDLDGSIAADAA